MDYAKNYTRERVSEALTVLASPDESPYALGVAASLFRPIFLRIFRFIISRFI